MADCTRVEHLTLKVTFACVDKSVFHSRFVDRVTTTTTTTKTTTTTTTTVSVTSSHHYRHRIPPPMSVSPKSVISSQTPAVKVKV